MVPVEVGVVVSVIAPVEVMDSVEVGAVVSVIAPVVAGAVVSVIAPVPVIVVVDVIATVGASVGASVATGVVPVVVPDDVTPVHPPSAKTSTTIKPIASTIPNNLEHAARKLAIPSPFSFEKNRWSVPDWHPPPQGQTQVHYFTNLALSGRGRSCICPQRVTTRAAPAYQSLFTGLLVGVLIIATEIDPHP